MPSRQPSRLMFSGLTLRKLPPRKPSAGGIQHLLQPTQARRKQRRSQGKPHRSRPAALPSGIRSGWRSALHQPPQRTATAIAARCIRLRSAVRFVGQKAPTYTSFDSKTHPSPLRSTKNAVPGGKKAKRLVGTRQMPYLYKPKVYMPHPSHANSSKALAESLQTRRRQRTRKR